MVEEVLRRLWLRMERGNGEGDVVVSKDEKHWEVQQRFEENSKDGDERTMSILELFRNELSPHVLQAFVVLKPRRRY